MPSWISQNEEVKFVATLPGDDILPIFDALHQNGRMPLILTRHEQATVLSPTVMREAPAKSCRV